MGLSIEAAKVGDEAMELGAGVLGRGVGGVDAGLGVIAGRVARNLSSCSSSSVFGPTVTCFEHALVIGYSVNTSFLASIERKLVLILLEVFGNDESDFTGL